MPNSMLIPHCNFAVPAGIAALHPSKAEELRFSFFSLPPFQSNFILVPVQLFIDVASPPFDVMHQNTDAINAIVRRQSTPVESDVGRLRPHNGGNVGRFGTAPSA